MIKAVIKDSNTSQTLKIESDGAIYSYIVPVPPVNSKQQALPISEYLTTTGVSTGSSSMLVNGSTNNVDFYIKARSYDLYINTIVFTIVDAASVLNEFGHIAALTNGLDFFYFNQESGRYIIETGLKSNYDMIRLANFEPAFGTGTAAFQLTNVVGASEAYVGIIDIQDIFGIPYGLRLRANTTDSIGFTVKDNITGLDAMNMKCFGFRID